MGRRGYVQSHHAEHDYSVCMSGWGQVSAVDYLERHGIQVCTGSDVMCPEDSDHWEIPIPEMKSANGDCELDFGRLEELVADLRAHPEAVTCDDGDGEYGDQLADVLERGIAVARERGYEWIIIDFM